MKGFESKRCPVCQSKLEIQRLCCPGCGAEYPVQLPLSRFEQLTEEETDFLISFLRCRGNLKAVGAEKNLSYPTVKKRLEEVLVALDLAEQTEYKREEPIDMRMYHPELIDVTKISDLVKRKIYENGGTVTIQLYNGDPCLIAAENDGRSFSSNKLGGVKYTYEAFDVIADCLRNAPGYRAPKGNARNKADKVGYGKCCEGTVIYYFAVHYAKKRLGESTFDPIFVLAAVMEWAGIIRNDRGYLELMPAYR